MSTRKRKPPERRGENESGAGRAKFNVLTVFNGVRKQFTASNVDFNVEIPFSTHFLDDVATTLTIATLRVGKKTPKLEKKRRKSYVKLENSGKITM